jgi:hypothetical protein
MVNEAHAVFGITVSGLLHVLASAMATPASGESSDARLTVTLLVVATRRVNSRLIAGDSGLTTS